MPRKRVKVCLCVCACVCAHACVFTRAKKTDEDGGRQTGVLAECGGRGGAATPAAGFHRSASRSLCLPR